MIIFALIFGLLLNASYGLGISAAVGGFRNADAHEPMVIDAAKFAVKTKFPHADDIEYEIVQAKKQVQWEIL